MKLLVLGAGRVGSAMAIDLAKEDWFDVAVADNDSSALDRLTGRYPIAGISADLAAPAQIEDIVGEYDLVISAVPGFMGFETLRTLLGAKKNVVDISFFPEDPFELDRLAKDSDVMAVVDCGVAPGMSNLLVGSVDARLERTDRVLIYVGGLPTVRSWPSEYKAGFSPIDVIEEYTRPARLVSNGKIAVRPALSDSERIEIVGVGTLEAFNTDGLRTLIKTIHAPFMVEKTLRYPGHRERISLLRDFGFFDTDPIRVGQATIRPIDFTSALLIPQWQFMPGETELTVMKILIDGVQDGRPVRYTYDMIDRYDPETGTTSMARTTGYAATMVARLIAEERFDGKGIVPPEWIGRDPEHVRFLLEGLEQRGICYVESISSPED
ncbi:saccharopine dehydrogenase NADP-binding domain-containing protein [Candidatus Bipolaricaulota bacterium]|nr:saccharopine dehydrogenase NADP-binding domain-containing protein [Candidatus Bipolaricaulota bacterium]